MLEGRELLAQVVVYSQPPSSAGGIIKSSWYAPNGLDGDAYAYDAFQLGAASSISQIQWRGGYTNFLSGAGKSPVYDFTISIYASIPAGIQPDVVNPPLAQYDTAGNAGETPAGTVGNIPMYDYSYNLSTPFQAQAGVKYWIQIEASQGVTPNFGWPPDWGLTTGTGGDGTHFNAITGGTNGGGTLFYNGAGDTAFTLLASTSTTLTPTVNVANGAFKYDAQSHSVVASATDANGNPVNGTFSYYYSQNGVAATPIAAGTYDVLATFTSADPKYGSATGTGTITINPAHTATAVTTSAAGPITYGQSVMITATVTNADTAVVPSGYVSFFKGGAYFGWGSLVNGVATLTTSSLTAGSAALSASYSATNFVTSTSNTVAQTVNPAHTATVLSSSATGPIVYGKAIKLTAKVTNTDTAVTPYGTVTFRNSNAVLGQATLVNGIATLTTSALPAGTDNVTAVFSGTNFVSSTSAVIKQVISKARTATKLTTAATGSVAFGQAVTFNVVVTNTDTALFPVGQVVFMDGATVLGTVTLNASGQASFTTKTLARGTHIQITAKFLSSPNFLASTSAPISVTVV